MGDAYEAMEALTPQRTASLLSSSELIVLNDRRHDIVMAALEWDERPSDTDACVALSDACHAYRQTCVRMGLTQ